MLLDCVNIMTQTVQLKPEEIIRTQWVRYQAVCAVAEEYLDCVQMVSVCASLPVTPDA